MAQGKPPRPPKPIIVDVITGLSFGTFYSATGGTVTVAPDGGRTQSGDVVLLSVGSTCSSVELHIQGEAGTIITPMLPVDVQLTGPGTMIFDVDSSDPVSPFVLLKDRKDPDPNNVVKLGATLEVGIPAANPAGEYTGTFDVIFNQQ
ncbi:MAG TPA: DUF4402 domain-containing protein [Bacteroidales bacterium]|nr:DUF4402 domain-containing protein [Bacteroidales bacterium]